MAAFDNTLQKMVTMAGVRLEEGSGVTIAGVSGQSFTVATKLKKVLTGFGITDTDGIACKATAGAPSSGQVTFTRLAPIVTSADTLTYILFGY